MQQKQLIQAVAMLLLLTCIMCHCLPFGRSVPIVDVTSLNQCVSPILIVDRNIGIQTYTIDVKTQTP